MSENNESKINARRKLLKSIAAGSGAVIAGKSLPESWGRPIVDSVMLPAHAQTSGLNAFTGNTNQASIAPDSHFARLADGMINEAHAVQQTTINATGICIKSDGVGTVSVDAIIDDGYISTKVSKQNVPIGGELTFLIMEDCNMPISGLIEKLGLIQDAKAGTFYETISVIVTSISGNAVGSFSAEGGEINGTIPFNLPPGDCTAPSCPIIPEYQNDSPILVEKKPG